MAIDVTNVEESDVPVDCYDNLFPTRRKELDRVYVYLKGIKTSDPYAIAISAGWGEGKTSIITVLQKIKRRKCSNICSTYDFRYKRKIVTLCILLN